MNLIRFKVKNDISAWASHVRSGNEWRHYVDVDLRTMMRITVIKLGSPVMLGIQEVRHPIKVS